MPAYKSSTRALHARCWACAAASWRRFKLKRQLPFTHQDLLVFASPSLFATHPTAMAPKKDTKGKAAKPAKKEKPAKGALGGCQSAVKRL